MLKKLIAVVFALSIAPSVAFSKGAPGSGANPYSDCGIGAALFQDVHWAAVISNVIWDLGTTAITSAVSSPETCNAANVNIAKMILRTLPELEKDIALGEGQYLTALHESMGCDAPVQASINNNVRASYADVVSNETYGSNNRVQRASDLYDTIKASTVNSCNVVL